MRLHPSVQRVINETVGETSIAVKVYAPNPTGARGFFPERSHPNLSIEFKAISPGKHIELAAARATHVQYSGDHFGGTANQAEYATKKRCLIISAIGYAQGGRYAAVALDHIAKNGGRLMGEGYFSWQGQRASVDESSAIRGRFFAKMNTLFGVPNLRIPNEKQDPALFEAAGIKVEKTQEAPQEAIPDIIKDHPDLLPAVKLLTSVGADFTVAPGLPTEIAKIPTDLNHQHLIQKALDDLKDAKVIDYDVSYDKAGRLTSVTVMNTQEGVDSRKKVAIIEDMKNNDLRATVHHGKFGSGHKITCQGVTFVTIENTDGSGSIDVVDGDKEFMLCEYEKGELVDKIRALAGKVTKQGITETVKECSKPVNG